MSTRQINYLLGKGENLTSPVELPHGGGKKKHPYTFDEAKKNLVPMARRTNAAMASLPPLACPKDEAVAVVTLHPTYLAKSFFPKDLLRAVGLRPVGSRPVTVTPRKVAGGTPAPTAAADLFVAGTRAAFRDFAVALPRWSEANPGAADLIKVEELQPLTVAERVKPIREEAVTPLLEVVLHAPAGAEGEDIREGFVEYMRKVLGVEVDLAKGIESGSLSFLPVRVGRAQVDDVAKFSFLRVLREMPAIRALSPVASSDPVAAARRFACSLPNRGPLDPTLRAAIFDGGIPGEPDVSPWATAYDAEGVTAAVRSFQQHGLAVTSAALFGPLEEGGAAPVPFAHIDHYRVLDVETQKDPQDQLYPVLKRIMKVLKAERYPFVGLSIGPQIAVEDHDVNLWTALLDTELSTGDMFAAIAAGNTGGADPELRLNRIQPPGDSVNGFVVGADDGLPMMWRRADYSSVGPGRSPGLCKPDGVAFGGTDESPFYALTDTKAPRAAGVKGTSFAGPSGGLRTALGLRAVLGPEVTPLAVKALLTHFSDPGANDATEVGWGRICTDIQQIITSPNHCAHVIYKGHLAPKKFVRARIPMPAGELVGDVCVTATICIATPTDPQDPIHYTRSGLEIRFRRDNSNIKPGKTTAPKDTFFGEESGMDESKLRTDARKWETTRRSSRAFDAATMVDPVFDIHYNPRQGGQDATDAASIPYAMVISLSAPGMPDFYSRVHHRFRHQLEPLRPVIQIPIPTRRI